MATINYTKKAEDCIVEGEGPNKAGRAQRMPFNHDPEKEAMLSDYRDKLTLDEVAENDIEMVEYAIKNSKRYFFNTQQQALAFVGRCIQMTMNHCGLMILEGMSAPLVQERMDKECIQIESRKHYAGDNSWRNGAYITKKGELVAFISVPTLLIPSPLAIKQKQRFFVITNAKVAMKGFH